MMSPGTTSSASPGRENGTAFTCAPDTVNWLAAFDWTGPPPATLGAPVSKGDGSAWVLCSAVCAGFSFVLGLVGLTRMVGSVMTFDCVGVVSGSVAFGDCVEGDACVSGDVCAKALTQTHDSTATSIPTQGTTRASNTPRTANIWRWFFQN